MLLKESFQDAVLALYAKIAPPKLGKAVSMWAVREGLRLRGFKQPSTTRLWAWVADKPSLPPIARLLDLCDAAGSGNAERAAVVMWWAGEMRRLEQEKGQEVASD